MNPETVQIGLTLIADVVNTLGQYSTGALSESEAHTNMLNSAESLNRSIAAFNAAVGGKSSA